MTLSDLASIGSLVSGVAVLVSLVYLSQQTRQNTKHTRALIQQGRAELARGLLDTMASNPSLAEISTRLVDGDPTVTAAQSAQFCYWVFSHFYLWEDFFFQHENDLIDDTRHTGLTLAIKARFQSPEFRAAWKLAGNQLSPDFQTFMNDLMTEVRVVPGENIDAAFGSTWNSLVAAERSGAGA